MKLIGLFFAVAIACGGTTPEPAEPMPALEPEPVEPEAEPAPSEPEPPKSLFERLGGRDSIKAVSSELLKRLRSNDTLNKNSKIAEARDKVDQNELAEKVTDFLCKATGGPCEYTGRSMKESHAHLAISDAEWKAMGEDFVAVLNHFNVPEAEQNELIALVETLKADIVQSLHDRIGGRDAILAISTDLLKRLSRDRKLNKNKKIKAARKKVNQKELAEKLADFVCMAAGGPCEYKGRPMKDSHADLGITEKEWDIMAKHFVAVLKKFKVPAREQQELIELVGTAKADIVTK